MKGEYTLVLKNELYKTKMTWHRFLLVKCDLKLSSFQFSLKKKCLNYHFQNCIVLCIHFKILWRLRIVKTVVENIPPQSTEHVANVDFRVLELWFGDFDFFLSCRFGNPPQPLDFAMQLGFSSYMWFIMCPFPTIQRLSDAPCFKDCNFSISDIVPSSQKSPNFEYLHCSFSRKLRMKTRECWHILETVLSTCGTKY